jgi:hypothetical protein
MLIERIRTLLVGHQAGKAVYGIIIALAIVITLEAHPPSAMEAEATILLGALAVAMAEFYSDVLQLRITERRQASRKEMADIGRHIGTVLVGSLLPLPVFIMASLGLLTIESAFVIVKWMLVTLLFLYGFVAAQIGGAGTKWSLLLGAMTGSIGVLVVLVKAALSH